MRPIHVPQRWLLPLAVALAACTAPQHASVRPPRPASLTGRPISDPPPSRVVVHVTLFRAGLIRELGDALPRSGDGDVDMLAGQKLHYTWQRDAVALKFDRGRIVASINVNGRVQFLGERVFPIAVSIAGEPVVTADFKAMLQSTEVTVKATGPIDRANRGIEEKLKEVIGKTLDDFRLDVRPLMVKTFARISKPIEIPVGDQIACAELRIAALEAGPTVLADGLEKDLGIVVLPSVTLPCNPATTQNDGGSASTSRDGGPSVVTAAADADAGFTVPEGFTLPLLANVASIPSGPFGVTVPVAAGYDELSRALEQSIKGKLYFSTDHPGLYLEKPTVYPSEDTVVIRLLLGGKVKVAGSEIDMDGEIFFAGHPRVIDNQITVPDLEITPGTAGELVKLKFALDHDAIRDQARAAMRVDISERLAMVKDKLSTELTFADNEGCVRAEVLRTEVTGIFPHESFLRIYVHVDGQASLYMPCKKW